MTFAVKITRAKVSSTPVVIVGPFTTRGEVEAFCDELDPYAWDHVIYEMSSRESWLLYQSGMSPEKIVNALSEPGAYKPTVDHAATETFGFTTYHERPEDGALKPHRVNTFENPYD